MPVEYRAVKVSKDPETGCVLVTRMTSPVWWRKPARSIA